MNNKTITTFFNGLAVRSLNQIERIGNKLPHPATLFALFAVLVVVLSDIITRLGVSAVHPGTGETILPVSLLNAHGFRYMYMEATKNFVHFPPLGIVLVATLGIGLADGSGLLNALLKQLVLTAPRRLVTATVILAGILSHLASAAGYVVLIPLGALIFAAFGRHPLAGLAAAFAGVSGGYSANFFIGAIDPILSGLTQSAAEFVDGSIQINPAVNFYFMCVSAILLILAGTWVTEKIVEPRLGSYKGGADTAEPLSKIEKRGLIWAGVSVVIVIGFLLLFTIPSNGLLRDPESGSLIDSPFMSGIITAVLILFFIPGLVYGVVTGSVRNDKDVVKHMSSSIKGLAGYIVLVFFAAQFVYFFKESNMGVLLAIRGAEWLKAVGFTGISLFIAFVLVSAFINLFMGSASAKWAIMAPIFVPMFMLLGYHPGITQAAFRIGDSVTNIITPMMSFFALIVAFAQKYDEKAGIGTLVAMMLPYSVVFFIMWTILLMVWMLLGLPTGPGAPLIF
ncbi:AbgT family transporter [candidate division KSB1 bacterium]|nr:AbgT family transporter [candidate division KSB1 bacterium]